MDATRTTSALARLPSAFARVWAAVHDVARMVKVRRRERSLRVCETLALGERRFLMVVQVERRRFLIGATNQSISLLERLDDRGNSAPGADDCASDNSSWNGRR